MGSTNYGTQTIYYAYGQALEASEFNKTMHNIITPGVYDGGTLSITPSGTINIAPVDIVCRTSSNQTIHVKTSDNTDLTISEAAPVVTAQFTWLDSVTNYMDFTAKPYSGVLVNDIILGKGNYVAHTLTSVDYLEKTWGGYESDVFTPVIKGSTYSGVATYTKQKGSYTRINDTVIFNADVTITNHTGSGTIKITGLPYYSGSGCNYSCNVSADSLTYTGTQITGVIEALSTGSKEIVLKQFSSGAASTFINIDTAFSINVTGQYSTKSV